jgi:hypothetical protein
MGERFGYMRSFHPTEITTKEGVEVDYDEQFAKTFLSIANRFIEPIGLPVINKRLSVLNSIFSSKVNGKKKVIKPIIEEDIDDDEPVVISSDDVILEEVDEMMMDDMYGFEEGDLQPELKVKIKDEKIHPIDFSDTNELIDKLKKVVEETVIEEKSDEEDDFWN